LADVSCLLLANTVKTTEHETADALIQSWSQNKLNYAKTSGKPLHALDRTSARSQGYSSGPALTLQELYNHLGESEN